MSTGPEPEFGRRPLHFIWLVDRSGSMQGKKIESLNFAVREALPAMRDEADKNPEAQVLMRVITFSDGAQWEVLQPTDLHSFQWTDVTAEGVTDMGKALQMAAEALKTSAMPNRGLKPVLVLVTDGQPTDNFDNGLKLLMEQPWGAKALRLAIAIGDDADMDVLRRFIANPEIEPLKATNSADLRSKIRWVSTAAIANASQRKSEFKQENEGGPLVPFIGPAPADVAPAAGDDGMVF